MASNHLIILPTSPAFSLSKRQVLSLMKESISRLFTQSGQSIGASALASVLPMNIQDRFPLGLTDFIYLQSEGLLSVFSNTTAQKHQFFGTQLSFPPTLKSIHDHWKMIALTRWTIVSKVMSLLFNMLCRFVIAFLPRSNSLSVSLLPLPSTVILEPPCQEYLIVSIFSPIYLPWSNGTGCHFLHFFECWVLSQIFHSPLSLSSRGSLERFYFLPLEWYLLHISVYWYFSYQSWFQLMIHPAWHFTWFTLCVS